MASQQGEESVEKADGVSPLPRSPARYVSADVGSLDFGQDSVEGASGGIGQVREVPLFQIEEFACERIEACDTDEETGYDENRLVVCSGRIAECSKIPGFVHEADLQRCLSRKGYGHRMVAIGSAAHKGSAIKNF